VRPSSASGRHARSKAAASLFLLAAAVALALAARVHPYLPGDLALARALQRAEPAGGDPLLHTLNTIGTGWGALILTTLYGLGLALARRPWLLAEYLCAQALRPLDTLLKALIDRPRPSPLLVHVSEHAAGTSFPSGHVFSAVLCYGTLALLLGRLELLPLPRRALQILCVAIVLLMGPARIVVGAHWPSDVLGSWLWSSVLLISVESAIAWVRNRVY
jgi:membrane-associated phospholipid phosphatase